MLECQFGNRPEAEPFSQREYFGIDDKNALEA